MWPCSMPSTRSIGAIHPIVCNHPLLQAHRVKPLRQPLPTSPWSACIQTKRRISIAFIKLRLQRCRMVSRNRKASSLANRWRQRFSLCERKMAPTHPTLYRPYTAAAGIYVPTVLPVASGWGQVTPFALKESAQFRPAAPVSLQSTQWAKDCDEVKKMGAKTGSARTAEQTDIARLWEHTGPGLHNPVARQLATMKKLDLLDNARLLRCTPWRWLILTSRYSTLNTPTTSGGR